MQAINVTILQSATIIVWFGTVFVGIAAAVISGGTPISVAAASVYSLGAVIVTGAGNVPLNDELAAADPDAADGQEIWSKYSARWSTLNALRTALFFIAAVGFSIEFGTSCVDAAAAAEGNHPAGAGHHRRRLAGTGHGGAASGNRAQDDEAEALQGDDDSAP